MTLHTSGLSKSMNHRYCRRSYKKDVLSIGVVLKRDSIDGYYLVGQVLSVVLAVEFVSIRRAKDTAYLLL